jgi:hypothetical protein
MQLKDIQKYKLPFKNTSPLPIEILFEFCQISAKVSPNGCEESAGASPLEFQIEPNTIQLNPG